MRVTQSSSMLLNSSMLGIEADIPDIPDKVEPVSMISIFHCITFNLTLLSATNLNPFTTRPERDDPNCLNRDYQFISEYLSLY